MFVITLNSIELMINEQFDCATISREYPILSHIFEFCARKEHRVYKARGSSCRSEWYNAITDFSCETRDDTGYSRVKEKTDYFNLKQQTLYDSHAL